MKLVDAVFFSASLVALAVSLQGCTSASSNPFTGACTINLDEPKMKAKLHCTDSKKSRRFDFLQDDGGNVEDPTDTYDAHFLHDGEQDTPGKHQARIKVKHHSSSGGNKKTRVLDDCRVQRASDVTCPDGEVVDEAYMATMQISCKTSNDVDVRQLCKPKKAAMLQRQNKRQQMTLAAFYQHQ